MNHPTSMTQDQALARRLPVLKILSYTAVPISAIIALTFYAMVADNIVIASAPLRVSAPTDQVALRQFALCMSAWGANADRCQPEAVDVAKNAGLDGAKAAAAVERLRSKLVVR